MVPETRDIFMLVLIIGLILFLGIHSVRIVAPGWAADRQATMGEGPWKGLYSLVSLAGLVLIVWGYSMARNDVIVWQPPFWMSHVTALLMLFSLILLAVFQLPAGRIKPAVKHPMLAAVKIWAFAHLLANGDLASIVLFGSFLAWAVVDRISVKRRGVAVAAPGPVKWDVAALVTGLVLYVLFVFWLHAVLFGVQPLAMG